MPDATDEFLSELEQEARKFRASEAKLRERIESDSSLGEMVAFAKSIREGRKKESGEMGIATFSLLAIGLLAFGIAAYVAINEIKSRQQRGV